MSTKLLDDSFEDGTANAFDGIMGNSSVYNVGSGNGADGGSYVLRCNWGNYSNIGVRKSLNFSSTGEIYLKYQVKFESTWNWNSGTDNNNKMLWVRISPNANSGFLTCCLVTFGGTRHWFPDGATFTNMGDWGEWYDDDWTPALNTWHKLEYYMKMNTGGGSNGILRIWQNGVLVSDHTNCPYRTGDSVWPNEIWFPGNNEGTSNPTSQMVQIDDVEIWDGMPDAGSPPTGITALFVR